VFTDKYEEVLTHCIKLVIFVISYPNMAWGKGIMPAALFISYTAYSLCCTIVSQDNLSLAREDWLTNNHLKHRSLR
jgi:hypothetical protein